MPLPRVIKDVAERYQAADGLEKIVKNQGIEFSDLKSGMVFKLELPKGELRKYDSCWAIIDKIEPHREYTVSIRVHDGGIVVEPKHLQPVDSEKDRQNIKAIANRIQRLRGCGSLDRGAYRVLDGLGKEFYLTEVEDKLLTCLEEHYLGEEQRIQENSNGLLGIHQPQL